MVLRMRASRAELRYKGLETSLFWTEKQVASFVVTAVIVVAVISVLWSLF